MKRKEPKAKRPRVVARANKESWIRGIKDADLKKLLAEHRKGTAPGFIFMRPVCEDNDCPDGPDPDDDRPPKDPCAGQTWVWQPDLAARLITSKDCPSAADLRRIEQALGGNLSRFRLPDPEVRVTCQGGTIDISIWGTRVQPNSCSDLARKRAQIPPDIANGGNFGVYISAALIRRLAQAAFDAAPKRLSANGAPSADGPIHLTSLSVGFKKPNIVQTFIGGYDERPWPDVSFTTTITDTLLDQRGCTSKSKTDPSKFDEVLAVLFAAVAIAVAVFVPVLIPLPAFALFNDINALLDQPDNPTEGGVGCRLLEGLPDQIPLPQTGGILPPQAFMARRIPRPDDPRPRPQRQKLVIPYNVPRVDGRGVLVSAFATIDDRMPAVRVVGPSRLSMINAASTYGYYVAHAEDFYGRLTVTWSGGPRVIITSPNAASTKVTFKRGTAKPGDSFEETIAVRVTDAEGSSVTASRTVLIYVNEPDNLPPICQIKPWLPQCQPGG